MGAALAALAAPAHAINCSQVVTPLDVSPARSPLAVHTFLAERFAGKRVVEIGTRNGDGMDCFARRARSAVAIEYSEPYCRKLELRAQRLAADGAGNFSVVCAGYEEGTPADFDVVTWWQMLPSRKHTQGLVNEEVLARLYHEAERGRVSSPDAEAVVLFDTSWRADMRSWSRLQRDVAWSARVPFDERVRCLHPPRAAAAALPRAGSRSLAILCNRSAGAFIVAGINIHANAQKSKGSAEWRRWEARSLGRNASSSSAAAHRRARVVASAMAPEAGASSESASTLTTGLSSSA